MIIDLPGFDVPASGIVEYQNMRVDNPFKEDAWLRAISIKPGDRSVLHHVVSNHMADPKLPKSKIPGGSVGSYTPGAEAQVIAKDAGAPVPAGGKLNFQMHYTTTGKADDRPHAGRLLHAEDGAGVHQALDRDRRFRPADPGRRGAPRGDLLPDLPGGCVRLHPVPALALSRLLASS